MPRYLIVVTALLLLTCQATAQTRGITGRKAPDLAVDSWVSPANAPAPPRISELEDDVVVLFFFQSWCPGCHSAGFPTISALIERYRGHDRVHFQIVQTVFEGFASNTPERAADTAKEYGISVPVGHAGAAGVPPAIMRDYRSGGTPWIVIIGPGGTVAFDGFRITPDKAAIVIDRLLSDAPPLPVTPLPSDRGGQDLVGVQTGHPDLTRWPTPRVDPAHAPLTLYRWWTDSCPYCEASLPAIDFLRRRYADRGLETIAIYHPKPPRDVVDQAVAEAARERSFHGAVAIDRDWKVLKEIYLESEPGGTRPATSVTLLIDAQGIVRYVHPGPEFHPSRDPSKAIQNSDYLAIDKAIDLLLPPRPDSATPDTSTEKPTRQKTKPATKPGSSPPSKPTTKPGSSPTRPKSKPAPPSGPKPLPMPAPPSPSKPTPTPSPQKPSTSTAT